MLAPETETRMTTIDGIFATAETPAVRRVLSEIFSDMHPLFSETKTDLMRLFTPETASEFLARIMDFESIISVEDSYEQTLQKFQGLIDKSEQIRAEVMAKLYDELRPIETSYRQVWLFFENSIVEDGKQRKPVELYLYSADPSRMKNRESATIEAIDRFVESRNDNPNFRDDICNLVIPGSIPMDVREKLEEIAYKRGMLLITDLADEKSYRQVVNQFRPDGRYEFLKRIDNKAASDVVLVGFLKLREPHWFEKQTEDPDAGLYAPASVAFAGALARTDRARNSMVQGPIGMKFGRIKGVEKARVECLISQMQLLSQEMQVIPIMRDSDNHLCFYGCRTLADDKYGVYKFFTAYRVLSYIERMLRFRLLEVAGQVLTREFMNQEIEEPIERMLREQVAKGAILEYDLFVDTDYNKRMQGICDIFLEVMPTGPAEVFRVKIDVPEFKPLTPQPAIGESEDS
jgi:type VI secretion system TssC-like protein